MNIKAISTALKNKVTSAAGAPGRAYVANKTATFQKNNDKEVGFLKDYNAKSKSGAPISNKDRAIFQSIKDR